MRKVEFYNHNAEVVDFIIQILEYRYLIQDYHYVVEADNYVSGYLDFIEEGITSEGVVGLFEYAESYLENLNSRGGATIKSRLVDLAQTHSEIDKYLLKRVVDVTPKKTTH